MLPPDTAAGVCYTRHKVALFLKSLGDNDMYAAVRCSHLTTRLIPLPGILHAA